MKHKTLFVHTDCEGALQTAMRIRIIYLQSYREEIDRRILSTSEANEKTCLQRASDAIMQDIANLTMLSDNLAEAQAN